MLFVPLESRPQCANKCVEAVSPVSGSMYNRDKKRSRVSHLLALRADLDYSLGIVSFQVQEEEGFYRVAGRQNRNSLEEGIPAAAAAAAAAMLR